MIKTVLFVLALCSLSSAANSVFYAASPAGSNNGTSCANAYAYSDGTHGFNVSGNWSVSPTGTQIGPDTTVTLCGTFTDSTPGDTLLIFQGSGTNGHPVTLTFGSTAILTNSAYWGSRTAGAVNTNGQSYLVIDGGTACGPNTSCQLASGATTGLITATGNGGSLANQQDSNGVYINGGSNVTVQNLAITNIYVHLQGGSDNTVDTDSGIGSDSSSNLIFQNNFIHDGYSCIDHGYAVDSSVTIQNNYLYNCNWGVGIGDRGAGDTMSGLTITGNYISNGVNWEDPSDAYHHNGMHVFVAASGNTITGLVEAGNYIFVDWGLNETAHIFNDVSTGTIPNALIYNNVLTESTTNYPANGFITSSGTGAGIYNNTIVGGTTAHGQCFALGGSATIENNICSTAFTGIEVNTGTSLTGSNYNVFYNLGGTGNGRAMLNGATAYNTVAAWTSGTGFDVNSQTGNPNLNANGTLQAGSSAINNGTNLTSLAITALNSDYAGFPRPSVAAWDVGAYNYQAPAAGGASCSGNCSFSGAVAH